ncbi:NAD-dependent epimerase/dehydratase family protein [Runella sp.]|uniref:NAD-dependent epimerase/dehydratase family protein n=1 Tax=Runella sp. TaxID=1960881 RepID=UPI003D0C69A6
MDKLLVTGGSGFIGTNLIDYYLGKNFEVYNLDIKKNMNPKHDSLWLQVDLLDLNSLRKIIAEINPDYVIHLAARTDLGGTHLDDYRVNFDGTENLIKALRYSKNVKKAVFASTMYVCKVGYQPVHNEDYCPHTIYGESKVVMEKMIRSNNLPFEWSIVRPTSIWGPWFGEPYRRFFDIVLNQNYLDIGKHSCTKTYGYVENTIFQIDAILNNKSTLQKTYYLGDYEPIFISDWAYEIAEIAKVRKPYKVSYGLMKGLAMTGDFIKLVYKNFPMTRFRLNNMTTDNIFDLTPTREIVGELPFIRIDGIRKTIQWIKNYN